MIIYNFFLYLKLFSLNSCKISRKLSITETDYNNIAGATLTNSLPTVDILFSILQGVRNIFFKENLRKTAQETCTCFNFMTPHSSIHQRFSIKIAILKNFTMLTGKHLCWSLFSIKLQD